MKFYNWKFVMIFVLEKTRRLIQRNKPPRTTTRTKNYQQHKIPRRLKIQIGSPARITSSAPLYFFFVLLFHTNFLHFINRNQVCTSKNLGVKYISKKPVKNQIFATSENIYWMFSIYNRFLNYFCLSSYNQISCSDQETHQNYNSCLF